MVIPGITSERTYDMKHFLEHLSDLDDNLSIWVTKEDLGREKLISHKKRSFYVKIPRQINKQITLRLKGLGKNRSPQTGDLYLHLWLNKGEDIKRCLWLSETFAGKGGEKILSSGEERIIIRIPPKSKNGLTLRLKGLGAEPMIDPRAPALDYPVRGNLLVRLIVYPDRITPICNPFDSLSTENMFLEGWVYWKFDEVIKVLGSSLFHNQRMNVETITDAFNDRGHMGIFDVLLEQLKLTNLKIELTPSASIPTPGTCQITPENKKNTSSRFNYQIMIKDCFLDDPFLIAAILAHELCHVVYTEKIGFPTQWGGAQVMSDKAILEIERTVDLFVFMFQVGEFQLRVAKNKGLTIGYFDQEVFERIQAFVSRKLGT